MSEPSSSSGVLPNQPNPLIDHHIPIFMLKALLYKCQINTSRTKRLILVITSGPHLHEVRDKEILRTCDLSRVFLAGIPFNILLLYLPLVPTFLDTVDAIDIDVFFTYTPIGKTPFYFVQIGHRLAILNAGETDQITVSS